jgi:hypothetical protein
LKLGLIAVVSLLLFGLFGVSCTPIRDFNARLKAIVKPYRFSITKWELNTFFNIWPLASSRESTSDDEIREVIKYFSTTERIKKVKLEIETIKNGDKQGDLTSLEDELNELEPQKVVLEKHVEKILKKQIKEALAQQGIFNPIDKYVGLKVSFPPINFKLEMPPHLLVISPRDKIESLREIVLQQTIRLEEMENIEGEIDELGVSSLVVTLGGFGGTYPTFVTNEASLRFTLATATEEWLHQYLAFKPLGFRYLLDLTGISRNYEIAIMNETVASMVSKEVSSLLFEKHYSSYKNGDNQSKAEDIESEFNQEMRNIRRSVDEYLARGEIEQAEQFMEEKRQYLATKGYLIRKLNQAYFAFHGTYADRPTSISPIGRELKELRAQSSSLKDFLETVSSITSRQDLITRLK